MNERIRLWAAGPCSGPSRERPDRSRSATGPMPCGNASSWCEAVRNEGDRWFVERVDAKDLPTQRRKDDDPAAETSYGRDPPLAAWATIVQDSDPVCGGRARIRRVSQRLAREQLQ